MRGMADDWDAGGPTRIVCRGYEDAPRGSVIQLRLLAGIFRLVLTDRAPELTPYYPCLGGREPAAHAWPVMRAVIADHLAELNQALTVAPQTNEVGRAAPCLPDYLILWPRPASAGSTARARGQRRTQSATRPLRLFWQRLAFRSREFASPADRRYPRTSSAGAVRRSRASGLRPSSRRCRHNRGATAVDLIRLALRP
jgi:hypothetical protein